MIKSSAPAAPPASPGSIQGTLAGYIPAIPDTSGSAVVTILIVDDDPWFRALFQVFVLTMSCNLIEARDGKAGMAVLRRVPVDILVTDLMMPEQGGFATIEMARAEFPKIKILAVSGVRNKAYCLRAAEMMGADAAIEKPITKKRLLRALGRLAA
jgi:CheY-like chemotaxis protein